MDADIVQRVRELASPVAEEAAQEIERLRSALKVEQEQANRWWAMHLKAEADTAAECLRLKNKVRELEFDGKAKDEALISMRDSLREADAMFRELVNSRVIHSSDCKSDGINMSGGRREVQLLRPASDRATTTPQDDAAMSPASTGSVGEPVTEALPTLERELCDLINRHGMERFSNTPDWVLARLLIRTLDAYASAVAWTSPCVNVAVNPERDK